MNNELFSRLKNLAQKENRARLAVLLGAAAMLLILLSELFTPSGKTAAESAARVCGVAVVCEGGGDVRVAARITELVGALLDVPSNRICVEQRRE